MTRQPHPTFAKFSRLIAQNLGLLRPWKGAAYRVTTLDYPSAKSILMGQGNTIDVREDWTFEQSQAGDEKRSHCAEKFWETLHIDLRMVDTSDFTIAFVPTNIYSVGTVHEIVLSRLQWKPVLFVSPPVTFPALDLLRAHLEQARDAPGLQLLDRLVSDVPVKPNPRGIPSLWYMPLVGSGNFFDGFGFADYQKKFGWAEIAMDERERMQPPQNPLLPFLERLTQELPQRWDNRLKKYVPNDDWLLWELEEPKGGGATGPRKQRLMFSWGR